jgi:hypothetical protein
MNVKLMLLAFAIVCLCSVCARHPRVLDARVEYIASRPCGASLPTIASRLAAGCASRSRTTHPWSAKTRACRRRCSRTRARIGSSQRAPRMSARATVARQCATATRCRPSAAANNFCFGATARPSAQCGGQWQPAFERQRGQWTSARCGRRARHVCLSRVRQSLVCGACRVRHHRVLCAAVHISHRLPFHAIVGHARRPASGIVGWTTCVAKTRLNIQ